MPSSEDFLQPEVDQRTLELYGGEVVASVAEFSKYGDVTVAFGREIKFPQKLVQQYMPDYVEDSEFFKNYVVEIEEFKE